MSEQPLKNKTVDTSQVSAKLNQIAAQVPGMVDEFLKNVAAQIVKKSQDDFPLDTGSLRKSIVAKVEGNTAIISAGNESVNYAATVHENLSARHPVGGAKFIEKNINLLASDGPDNFAQTIANNLLKRLNK